MGEDIIPKDTPHTHDIAPPVRKAPAEILRASYPSPVPKQALHFQVFVIKKELQLSQILLFCCNIIPQAEKFITNRTILSPGPGVGKAQGSGLDLVKASSCSKSGNL